MTTRKYTLKPGRHQFAPGSHAVHENESLSDEEAEWYLKRYPHIAALFETMPDDDQTATDTENACRVSVAEPMEPIDHPDSYQDSEIITHQPVKSKKNK